METLFGTPIICPTLIGRTAELTALRLLVDRAGSGKGQLVLLSGEAGIGKSRLVAEAKTYATAQGFLLLQGQCFPTDRSCPYAPLLDLLRSHVATSSREQVVTEMGSLASALSPLLPDLFPLPSDLPPLPPLILSRRNVVSSPPWLSSSSANNQTTGAADRGGPALE